jgi:hypothetical protein
VAENFQRRIDIFFSLYFFVSLTGSPVSQDPCKHLVIVLISKTYKSVTLPASFGKPVRM